YRAGALGVEAAGFDGAFADAGRSSPSSRSLSNEEARRFFERHFRPFRVVPDHAPQGFVTGFYEPEVDASPVRTDHFRVPLLGVPDDLVKIDDSNRPPGL